MSTMLAPRPYQVEALAAVKSAWNRGLAAPVSGHPAVVLPTGLGKTVIFAHLVEHIVKDLGGKPMVLVHRDELVQQAAKKILAVAPDLTVGIVKAAQKEVMRQAIVASVQTLSRQKRRDELPKITHIIIDECHHAAAKSYRDVIDHFPGVQVVGFTATLARQDKLGLGDVFSEVVYTKDILFGIQNGFLCDVVGKTVTIPDLDLEEVRTRHGDYADEELALALEEAEAGQFIAKAYLEHAGTRQGVLFAPNVSTAFSFAQDMNNAGIITEVITGDTPLDERAKIYARYQSGATQVLSNCMVLTEGWDAPHASVAVIARPTSSVALYVQMVGRVLRPHPGKGVALVLDVVGISSKLALASVIDLAPTQVKEVREGETLVEALEREEDEEREGGGRIQKAGRSTHGLELAEIDLFHRSATMWLQTEAGAWFIPTTASYFLLWPEDVDSWMVGTIPNKIGKPEKLKTGLTFEMAKAWAEQMATMADPTVASRTASWRKKGGKASDAQLSYADSLGIDTEGMNKTKVSDAISMKLMSRKVPKPYPTFA